MPTSRNPHTSSDGERDPFSWLHEITAAVEQDVRSEVGRDPSVVIDEVVADAVDAWLDSDVYAAFVDMLDESKAGKFKARAVKPRLTKRKLDDWIINNLPDISQELHDAASRIGKRVAMLWKEDPILTTNSSTDLLEYCNFVACSSLPRWALEPPSSHLQAAFPKSSLPQNFYYVLAYALVGQPGWIKCFSDSATTGNYVPLQPFVEQGVPITQEHAGVAGLYLLLSPDGRGYLGDTINFVMRMMGHNAKGVNRYVRAYKGDDPERQFEHWTKLAVYIYADQDIPCELRRILEPAWIALGGFDDLGWNINYFDNSTMVAKASALDVIYGCMAIVRDSYATTVEGYPVRLPAQKYYTQWAQRYGLAFGGHISGSTISGIAVGHKRVTITRLLPKPLESAWLKSPAKVYQPTTGAPVTDKPKGHHATVLHRRPKVASRAHVVSNPHQLTKAQDSAMATAPIAKLPSIKKKARRSEVANGRSGAARAALAEKAANEKR